MSAPVITPYYKGMNAPVPPRPRKRYYELAKREALKSNHPRVKMACVLVKGKKVLAIAANHKKTHPKWGLNGYGYLHAETAALAKAEASGIDVTGCEVYVWRRGERLAKPCSNCYKALLAAGVGSIYYTDTREGAATR